MKHTPNVLIDMDTGTAEEYLSQHGDPDVETRFPVPNERRIRTRNMSDGGSSTNNVATRDIQYRGTGHEVSQPTNLPFSPPGLTWRGHPAVTLSQLQRMASRGRGAGRGRGRPPSSGM